MEQPADHVWITLLVLLILFVAFLSLLLPYIRKRAALRKAVREERDALLGLPVPDDIQRSIRAYRLGDFAGEEQSPLAYVGYRVGIARGLPRQARHYRLVFCFRMEMPADLPAKYHRWGRPATLWRFRCIQRHLSMLADQRRSRPNFTKAVGDWDGDRQWFQAEMLETAVRFGGVGFRR